MKIGVYYCICVLTMVLCGGTLLGFCMEQLVPAKEDAPAIGKRLLLWTLIPALSVPIKAAAMNAQNIAPVLAAFDVFYIGGELGMVGRYYGGKRFEKYRRYLALLFMTAAGDMSFGLLYWLVTGEYIDIPSYNTANAAIGCTGTALIGAFYMILLVWLVKRREQEGRGQILVLMVFVAVLVCAGVSAYGEREAAAYDVIFIFISACILFFLYLCLCISFVLGQIREANRERENFAQALEIERQRYAAIEARQEELAKLRHDYRNLLTTVSLLLEHGEEEKARELLQEMSIRVFAAEDAPLPAPAQEDATGAAYAAQG